MGTTSSTAAKAASRTPYGMPTTAKKTPKAVNAESESATRARM